MPSRPNSSRPGCWTCKKRHRRCDGSQPTCHKCAVYGEECEGFGSRRLAFRDSTPKVQEKHRSHRLTTASFRSFNQNSLPAISMKDRAVLCEFIESVASKLALTDSHNIWRDDVAQMVSDESNHRLLLQAILGVTLMHRTHLEFRITPDAVMHYDLAVKNLQAALEPADLLRSSQLDNVLATLFLLVWFEILAQDWEKWNVHLAALADLFNGLDPSQIAHSRFRQVLLSAVARLDVPNTIWRLNPPLLNRSLYELLRSRGQRNAEPQSLDDAAVRAFESLHAIMGQFADIYADWLRGVLACSEVAASMLGILEDLNLWHRSLPRDLQLSDDINAASATPKTPLQCTILVHYLSTKLFALYVLNPDCSAPGDTAYPFCHQIARNICTLIDGLGPPERRNFTRFRGDVGMILPLSIASMFLHTDAELRWACHWARHAKHEGMWCGRRRSMIMAAWARCQRENTSIRPMHTMIGPDNIRWKPGKSFNICIMTHDKFEGRTQAVEMYSINEEE